MERYIKVDNLGDRIDVTISQHKKNQSDKRRKQKKYQNVTASSVNRLNSVVLFNATIFPEPEIWAFYGEN